MNQGTPIYSRKTGKDYDSKFSRGYELCKMGPPGAVKANGLDNMEESHAKVINRRHHWTFNFAEMRMFQDSNPSAFLLCNKYGHLNVAVASIGKSLGPTQ